MKRINQIVNGITEEVKAKFKEKKIYKALEINRMNAEEQYESAKAELDEFPAIAKDMTPEDTIKRISALMDNLEEAELTIQRMDKIKAYLDEEC